MKALEQELNRNDCVSFVKLYLDLINNARKEVNEDELEYTTAANDAKTIYATTK